MGQIKVEKNVGGIEGLYVIEPAVHGDARGYFMETYNEKDMKEAGIDIHFVQDNQSMSTKGVLRGLHFQKQYPQCKLVRAVRGTVFDVAVDALTHKDSVWATFPLEIIGAFRNMIRSFWWNREERSKAKKAFPAC